MEEDRGRHQGRARHGTQGRALYLKHPTPRPSPPQDQRRAEGDQSSLRARLVEVEAANTGLTLEVAELRQRQEAGQRHASLPSEVGRTFAAEI